MILKPLDTIECRDAIVTPDGIEPKWPEVDVVIGNPPFLGTKPMRGILGDEYTDRMRNVYKDAVPAFADLVCYWFHKAGRAVANGKVARAGLVATNSIRGGRNRTVLDRIVDETAIFDAWADEPWVVDGAAVRVSLVCFASKGFQVTRSLNGEPASHINADLTPGGVALTRARRLAENKAISFIGHAKRGPFDISGNLATRMAPPSSQSERSNQRRCSETVDERNGPDPAVSREVDHRLRFHDE